MKTNKLFEYFMNKGDLKSAMRIKKSFFLYTQPHERAIRKQKRLNILIENLRNQFKNN